jgi:hypothetical protein
VLDREVGKSMRKEMKGAGIRCAGPAKAGGFAASLSKLTRPNCGEMNRNVLPRNTRSRILPTIAAGKSGV